MVRMLVKAVVMMVVEVKMMVTIMVIRILVR